MIMRWLELRLRPNHESCPATETKWLPEALDDGNGLESCILNKSDSDMRLKTSILLMICI